MTQINFCAVRVRIRDLPEVDRLKYAEYGVVHLSMKIWAVVIPEAGAKWSCKLGLPKLAAWDKQPIAKHIKPQVKRLQTVGGVIAFGANAHKECACSIFPNLDADKYLSVDPFEKQDKK